MSSRKKFHDRCLECLMRRELCLCAEIPVITLETRLVVIMSKREIKTPTNTGRLAAKALTNSVVLAHGDQDRPFHLLDHLMPGRPSLVLYPSDEAIVLSPSFVDSLASPVNLIVPDGNWRQTSKMRKRIPHLSEFPQIKVPLSGESLYRVRKESKDEGLATIEAIARTLQILEGTSVREALDQLLHAMTSRVMSSRGMPKATPQSVES